MKGLNLFILLIMLKTIKWNVRATTKFFIFFFARKKEKVKDMQQFQAVKSYYVSKYAKKYQLPGLFKHEDILYEEQIYGNKSDICGITENNDYSAQFVLEVIDQGRPKHLILGGFNDTQARFQLNRPPKRFGDEPILQASKLYCKSSLLTMIHDRNKEDIDFYYNSNSKLILNVNHLDKRIQINNYIIGAHSVILSDQCNISYGKPSSIYIYQDLILSLSLQQLKQIFQKTITKVKQNNSNSILNKGAVILEQIRSYAMNQQPQLYSKQITYTTALLNRLTKIGNKNLLLIPNVFVKRIAQNCHHIDFPPEHVYRNYLDDHNSQNYLKLQNIISQGLVNQILQKFAILSFLKGFALELELHYGKNIFQNSIYKKLFSGMSHQQILSMYLPLKKKYRQKIHQIQRIRVKNVLLHNQQQQFMSIQKQWNQLQKRKQSFPYDFQVKNLVTQQEDALKLQNLNKKIEQIVQYQCDDYEKKLFKIFKEGSVSKEGIILYSKLVGKANVTLRDRVKLPIFHYGAFRGFYKQNYRDYLLYDQDKKFRQKHKAKISKIQQKFQKIVKQVNDPLTLKKYISGQMGPVKQVNFDSDGKIGNQSFSHQQEEFLKKIFGQIDSEISQQMLTDLQQIKKKSGKSKIDDQFDNL